MAIITHRAVQDMSSWLASIFPPSSDLETQADSLWKLLYFSGLHYHYCLHSDHRTKKRSGDCTPYLIPWSLCWKGTQVSLAHIQLARNSHVAISICKRSWDFNPGWTTASQWQTHSMKEEINVLVDFQPSLPHTCLCLNFCLSWLKCKL